MVWIFFNEQATVSKIIWHKIKQFFVDVWVTPRSTFITDLISLIINSVRITLPFCKLLCFADDMKLFMEINSAVDCAILYTCNYYISGLKIIRVHDIVDLGFKLSRTLISSPHITIISCTPSFKFPSASIQILQIN
jgi:hypothetical protein